MTTATLEREQRFLPSALGAVAVRGTAGGAKRLTGYAAVFDALSEDLGGFHERIAPGAFRGVLRDDVRALFNHREDNILGRTRAGTLKLREDATGLHYEITLAEDSPLAASVASAVRRGDVNASSFSFVVADDGETWTRDARGRAIRTITRVARLFDVGPVTFPAYPDTTAAARSLARFRIRCDRRDDLLLSKAAVVRARATLLRLAPRKW